jgi:hypothetical protein
MMPLASWEHWRYLHYLKDPVYMQKTTDGAFNLYKRVEQVVAARPIVNYVSYCLTTISSPPPTLAAQPAERLEHNGCATPSVLGY